MSTRAGDNHLRAPQPIHMNLTPFRLARHDIARELHKGRAGVARDRLCEDVARPRVERRQDKSRLRV
jgi:hypothetical protein